MITHSLDLEESRTGGATLATRPAHVVLAECDRDTRQLVASMLRRDGHEVIVARDSDELVEHLGSLCLQHEVPDLIVSDARMPGGLEVLESLRESHWTPTPVIVITTSGDFSLEVDPEPSPADWGQCSALITLQKVDE